MPIGNQPSLGGGGSGGSPDTAEQIRGKLETLLGTERLDASSIKNIPEGSASLLSKIHEVALGEGLAHGDAFSQNGADDFLAALGTGATFASGDRALPAYYNSGGNIAFFGGSGDDPTDATNAIIEIVIPHEYFTTSQELRVTAKTSSASGTRKIWAYAGDATASGVELNVTRGATTNTSSNQRTVFFDISNNSEDIHLYVSKQVILDIALPNKSGRWGALFTATKLAEAVKFAQLSLNVVHGNTLSHADSNTALIHMGVGAYFRTTNDRALPNVFSSGDRYGIYGGDRTADETTDGRACEIVIPAHSLQHNMVIEVLRESSSSGAANSRMVAYSGDPTSGGTKLVPISGTEAWTSTSSESTVAWNVSTTPTAVDEVTEDLHICIMGQSVFALDLYKVATHVATDNHVQELRGGSRPAVFSASTVYSKYDRVFYNDSSWVAIEHLSAGSWDVTKWLKASILDNVNAVIDILDKHSLYEAEFLEVRGETRPADFDPSVNYYKYDVVFYNNATWVARADITAGVWNPDNFMEAALIGLAETLVVVGDVVQQLFAIEDELRGGNRPSDFSSTLTYTKNAKVFHNGSSWVARRDLGAGAFDEDDWLAANLFDVTDHLLFIDEENVRLQDQVDTLRGGAGVYPDYAATGKSYTKGEFMHEPTLGKNYSAKDDIPAPAGAFDAALWFEASLAASVTPSTTKDLLESLTGSDRLEASAIQNLPTGGGGSHEVVTKTVNPANQWMDLVVWDALSPVTLDASAADISLYGVSTTNNFVLECTVKMFATRGTSDWDGNIKIESLITEYPTTNVPAKYRILRDSVALGDVMRFQVLIGVDFDIDWLMLNNFSLPYSSAVTFDINNFVDIPNQQTLEEMDVTRWEELGIRSGSTDGITAKSIHDLDAACSIDFSQSTVDIYAGDQIVGQFEDDGVSFTGGEYGSWGIAASDPFAASLTYPVLTENTNPINPVILTITDSSTGSGIWQRFMYSGLGNYCVAPEDTDARLTFNYQGVDTNTSIKTKLRIYSIFGSTWEARLPDGTVVASLVQAGGSKLYESEFTFEVTEEMRDNGEADITLNHVSGGFANSDAIFEWEFDVVSVEPERDPNVVLQVDSNYRGVMLPRVAGAVTTLAVNPAGAIALNKERNNSPIWSNGLSWNNIKTANFQAEKSLVDTGYFSQVKDGQLTTFGWVSHSPGTLPVQTVDGYGGFSRLLHINDTSTGTISGAIRNLTTTEAVYLSDHGFRWDFEWLPEANAVLHYMEFNASFHGGRGRFLLNFTHDASQITITNGSDSQTAYAPSARMLKVACFVAPASTDMQVYIDGVFAFTFPYDVGAGENVNRMHHTSGTSSGTGRSGYLLSSNLTVLQPIDHYPTVEEIQSSLELFIPNVNSASTITVPRSVFPIGTEFKVVNGSSIACTVQGHADDAQAFGGKSHFEIQPFTHATFIQTATPYGSYWTVDGEVDHHVSMSIDSSHVLRSRKGNYHGEINVTSIAVGHFQVQLVGHNLLAHTPITATVNLGSGGWQKAVCANVDVGRVNVYTGDLLTDVAEDMPVTISVTW